MANKSADDYNSRLEKKRLVDECKVVVKQQLKFNKTIEVQVGSGPTKVPVYKTLTPNLQWARAFGIHMTMARVFSANQAPTHEELVPATVTKTVRRVGSCVRGSPEYHGIFVHRQVDFFIQAVQNGLTEDQFLGMVEGSQEYGPFLDPCTANVIWLLTANGLTPAMFEVLTSDCEHRCATKADFIVCDKNSINVIELKTTESPYAPSCRSMKFLWEGDGVSVHMTHEFYAKMQAALTTDILRRAGVPINKTYVIYVGQDMNIGLFIEVEDVFFTTYTPLFWSQLEKILTKRTSKPRAKKGTPKKRKIDEADGPPKKKRAVAKKKPKKPKKKRAPFPKVNRPRKAGKNKAAEMFDIETL